MTPNDSMLWAVSGTWLLVSAPCNSCWWPQSHDFFQGSSYAINVDTGLLSDMLLTFTFCSVCVQGIEMSRIHSAVPHVGLPLIRPHPWVKWCVCWRMPMPFWPRRSRCEAWEGLTESFFRKRDGVPPGTSRHLFMRRYGKHRNIGSL